MRGLAPSGVNSRMALILAYYECHGGIIGWGCEPTMIAGNTADDWGCKHSIEPRPHREKLPLLLQACHQWRKSSDSMYADA